jgi:hypothetical protein
VRSSIASSIREYRLADSIGRGQISGRSRSSDLQVLAGEGPNLEETGPRAGSHPAGRQRFARCSGVRQRAYPGKRLWEGGLGEEMGLAMEGR